MAVVSQDRFHCICATSGILANAKHANFMSKYGNFENQPLARKPLPIEHKDAQFRRPAIERELVYVQLLELWPMSKLVVKQSTKAHRPLVLYLRKITLKYIPVAATHCRNIGLG